MVLRLGYRGCLIVFVVIQPRSGGTGAAHGVSRGERRSDRFTSRVAAAPCCDDPARTGPKQECFGHIAATRSC
jgi:hypothetical protein